jgi:hypothetical protein
MFSTFPQEILKKNRFVLIEPFLNYTIIDVDSLNRSEIVPLF